jgi:uncharacterized membrane protein
MEVEPMLLGVLAILTGITLFQPHRITRNRTKQAAIRGVGLVLMALTVWVVIETLRRMLTHA